VAQARGERKLEEWRRLGRHWVGRGRHWRRRRLARERGPRLTQGPGGGAALVERAGGRPAARGGRRGAVARELAHGGERSRNGSGMVLAADVNLGRNVWGACAGSAGAEREHTARTGPGTRAGVEARGNEPARGRFGWR
jgi:hypothetical protein